MESCWELLNWSLQKECPAYPDHGRQCFAVTGTLCRVERQGAYEAKINRCRECAVYEKFFDGGVREGLFINMTTVLPLSGPVGLPKETFLGSAGRPPCRSRVPMQSKWQDGGIIPDQDY